MIFKRHSEAIKNKNQKEKKTEKILDRNIFTKYILNNFQFVEYSLKLMSNVCILKKLMIKKHHRETDKPITIDLL